MSFTKVSEKIVLNKLKNIENGNLKLVNYDGKVFPYGNVDTNNFFRKFLIFWIFRLPENE